MATKKINQGPVEIDYEDCSLVIHYEVVNVVRDDNGRIVEIVGEAKPDSKRIKIKSISPERNLAQMAAEIVEKSKKYLHSSRVEEIEQLLIKLRKFLQSKENNDKKISNATNTRGTSYLDDDNRDINPPVKSKSDRNDRDRNDRDRNDRNDRDRNDRNDRKNDAQDYDPYPEANINDLDDYHEMLYHVSGKTEKEREEGLKTLIKGTGMILKLCREITNLEQIIQNGTVMGALTRTLQEEYKKSIDVTFNILRIFLAFSNFAELHPFMSNYGLGLLSMKVIEFEIKRVELRENETKVIEANWDKEISDIRKQMKIDSENSEAYQKDIERVKTLRSKETAKNRRLSKKQDKVFFVAFYILLNLAEDISTERKMVKKSLIETLIKMLDRSYEHLLALAATFLRKLSLIEENKDAMRLLNLAQKCTKFLPCSSSSVTILILRLLFNLSFDMEFRSSMIKNGYVPKLIAMLKTPELRARTLKLLYHLSVDDRCKGMFTYSDGIPILMGMVINFPKKTLAPELGALMINLSLVPKNVEAMISNKGLSYLMDRLSDSKDQLLLKIIRNISLWSYKCQTSHESEPNLSKYNTTRTSLSVTAGSRGATQNGVPNGLWAPHVKTFIEICRTTDDHDILVEVLGILANLTEKDIPANSSWNRMLQNQQFLGLLSKVLIPGMAQSDVQLEAVMLIANMASEPAACVTLASSKIIPALYALYRYTVGGVPAIDIMSVHLSHKSYRLQPPLKCFYFVRDKLDDVEVVLQVTYCFYKLLLQETSREEVMYSTRAVSDIIESLSHRNKAVREMADQCAEIIVEVDRNNLGELGAMGLQILKKRFEAHNQVWLRQFGNGLSFQSGHDDSMSRMTGYGGSMGYEGYDEDSMSASFIVGGPDGGGYLGNMGFENAAMKMSSLDIPKNGMFVDDKGSFVKVEEDGDGKIDEKYDRSTDWKLTMKSQHLLRDSDSEDDTADSKTNHSRHPHHDIQQKDYNINPTVAMLDRSNYPIDQSDDSHDEGVHMWERFGEGYSREDQKWG